MARCCQRLSTAWTESPNNMPSWTLEQNSAQGMYQRSIASKTDKAPQRTRQDLLGTHICQRRSAYGTDWLLIRRTIPRIRVQFRRATWPNLWKKRSSGASSVGRPAFGGRGDERGLPGVRHLAQDRLRNLRSYKQQGPIALADRSRRPAR